MKALVFGGMILIALAVQTTILAHLAFFGARPDVLLILVISFALLRGPDEGKWFGLAGGLVSDLFLTRLFGMQTLIKMLTGYWAGSLAGKFFSENWGIPMAASAIFTGIQETVLYGLSRYVGGLPWELGLFVRTALPRAIAYNLLLTPWIYLVVSRINNRFRRRELTTSRITRRRK